MSDNDADQVKPVDPDLTGFSIPDASAATVSSNNPPTWVWFAVGGLLLLALLVIFVLPAIVSEYELPLERRPELRELIGEYAEKLVFVNSAEWILPPRQSRIIGFQSGSSKPESSELPLHP